jgi:hypothetical protein
MWCHEKTIKLILAGAIKGKTITCFRRQLQANLFRLIGGASLIPVSYELLFPFAGYSFTHYLGFHHDT